MPRVAHLRGGRRFLLKMPACARQERNVDRAKKIFASVSFRCPGLRGESVSIAGHHHEEAARQGLEA